VAAAAGNVVPIYVDCTAKGSFPELQEKYKVKGYPTVLYVDAEGKQIRESGTREAGALVAEIGNVAKKYPGRPTFWNNSVKSATATKKRVAVYVAKEDADPIKVTMKLSKELGDRKTKLAWTWETGTAKVLEGRGVESAPAVVLYEAADKDGSVQLLGKVTIKEGDDPKLLNNAIDEILKNAKK
jgi:hypothetical protein